MRIVIKQAFAIEEKPLHDMHTVNKCVCKNSIALVRLGLSLRESNLTCLN